MKTFHVRINVEKSFEFDDEIEAADEVDAEEIAKSRLWRGDYQREERACAEITDEIYNAEEQEQIVECEICAARYSNLKDEDERGYTLVEAFEESDQVIYQPQEISMSYKTLEELIMSWWDSMPQEMQDEIKQFIGDQYELHG